MSPRERFNAYIEAYAAQDLDSVAAMFADDDGDTVAGELKIVVDTTDELHVVDVVTFAPDGRIASIRAYLGRAD